MSNGPEKRPLALYVTRGLIRPWRIGDLDIPCQVASPQSLTPFLQAKTFYPQSWTGSNHHWTSEPCLEKSRGLGQSPRYASAG